MRPLLDVTYTRVTMIDMGTEDVYIIFNGLTGVGYALESEATDFYSLSKTRTTIFITDKSMSWGNNLDWDRITEVVNPHILNKKVTLLGLSMGGTNAIICSQFIKANTVIAFNPQYSVYPEFFNEPEYGGWTKNITEWKFKTIHKSFRSDIDYFVFMSRGHDQDTWFLKLFPKDIYMYDFGYEYGHNIALEIKNEGRMYDLFDLVDNKNLSGIEDFINIKK